jgi:hypothetical protein
LQAEPPFVNSSSVVEFERSCPMAIAPTSRLVTVVRVYSRSEMPCPRVVSVEIAYFRGFLTAMRFR